MYRVLDCLVVLLSALYYHPPSSASRAKTSSNTSETLIHVHCQPLFIEISIHFMGVNFKCAIMHILISGMLSNCKFNNWNLLMYESVALSILIFKSKTWHFFVQKCRIAVNGTWHILCETKCIGAKIRKIQKTFHIKCTKVFRIFTSILVLFSFLRIKCVCLAHNTLLPTVDMFIFYLSSSFRLSLYLIKDEDNNSMLEITNEEYVHRSGLRKNLSML